MVRLFSLFSAARAVLCFYGWSLSLLSTLPYPQSAHAQDASGSNLLSSSLRGTVINSVTHEAIGRALVFSPDNRFATFTDDQGHFEFQLPRMESGTNLSTGESGFSTVLSS
jgi:hypothetical protein